MLLEQSFSAGLSFSARIFRIPEIYCWASRSKLRLDFFEINLRILHINLNVCLLTGEGEGHWEEVHVRSSPELILCHEVLVLLQLFFVSFQIFDHEVFAGEFVVVGEVIDNLVVVQANSYLLKGKPDLGLNRLRTVHTVAQ